MTVADLISQLEAFGSGLEILAITEDGEGVPILHISEAPGKPYLLFELESTNMCTCGHVGGDHSLWNTCLKSAECGCPRFTIVARYRS